MVSTDPLLSRSSDRERSQILSSNDHLHTIVENCEAGEINELTLFARLLEWMEIEGAMIKSYDELVGPVASQQKIFRAAELKTVDKALDEVDRIVSQLMAGFFKEFNFACGVLNTLLVTYVFAAHPQHFWLLYLFEGLYLLPRNLYDRVQAKPLNRVLSYLDYCWMMNTVALLSLICLVLHSTLHLPFSDAARKQLFVLLIGTACGPLMGAAMVLPFVALLFHSIDTMTGLFIHIFPPMLAFTLRWYPDLVRQAWPGVFKLDYLSEVHYYYGGGLSTVAGCSIACYFAWLIPYTVWMLLVGLNLSLSEFSPETDGKMKDRSFALPIIRVNRLTDLWDLFFRTKISRSRFNHEQSKNRTMGSGSLSTQSEYS